MLSSLWGLAPMLLMANLLSTGALFELLMAQPVLRMETMMRVKKTVANGPHSRSG